MSEQSFDLNNKFITSREAAQHAGYSNDYIGQLCREGRVDAKKVGKIWSVSKSSLDEYLDSERSKVLESKTTLTGSRDVAIHNDISDAEISNKSFSYRSVSHANIPILNDQRDAYRDQYKRDDLEKHTNNTNTSFFASRVAPVILGITFVSAGLAYAYDMKGWGSVISFLGEAGSDRIVYDAVSLKTIEPKSVLTRVSEKVSRMDDYVYQRFDDGKTSLLLAQANMDSNVFDTFAQYVYRSINSVVCLFWCDREHEQENVIVEDDRKDEALVREPLNISNQHGVVSIQTVVQSERVIERVTEPVFISQGTITREEFEARLGALQSEVKTIPRYADSPTGSSGGGSVVYRDAGANNYGLNGDQITIPGNLYANGNSYFDTDTLVVDDTNRKVGIGTTSPFAKFSIAGDLVLTGKFYDANSSAGTNGFVLRTTGTTTEWVAVGDLGISQTFTGLTDTLSSLTASRIIYTSADGTTLTDSANFVFDGTNLGVGTTTPGYRVGIGGTLGVTGTTNLATTTITGLLTVNGNTNITEGGELTVGDKVISEGEIGAGTSTPAAKLAVQNTLTDQTASLIYGAVGQTAPLFDVFDNPTINANLFRITADGKVGVGTTSPFAKFAIRGDGTSTGLNFQTTNVNHTPLFTILDNGRVGINNSSPAYPLDVTGEIRTTDDIQFTGAAGVGMKYFNASITFSNSNGSITLNPHLGNTLFSAGNVGIGTTSPYAKLSVVGDIVGSYFNATSSTGYQLGGSTILTASTSNNSLFIGSNAGLNMLSTGTGNIGIGLNALYTNTTGDYSVAIGNSALRLALTAQRNVAIGYEAMESTTGSSNTAVGYNVLKANTTGSENVAIGENAMSLSTASQNTAVGYQSLIQSANSGNSAFGHSTLFSNTSGQQNIAIGFQAGYGVSTGNRNILVGYQAGVTGGSLTTGSNNILIGHQAGATSSTMTNGLNIGNLIYGTGLGGTGTTLSTGNIGIGTTSPGYKLHVYVGTDTDVAGFTDSNGTCTINPTSTALSCSSDRTLKKDISSLDPVTMLQNVVALNAVNYHWKTEDSGNPLRLGFIAQEVEKVFPEFVTIGPNGKKAVSYGSFTPVLASAIQAIYKDIYEMEPVNTKGQSTLLGRLLQYFENAGVKIANGLTTIKDLVAHKLTVGTSDKPTGITLYDEVSGNPYCLVIRSGQPTTYAGECGTGAQTVAVANSGSSPAASDAGTENSTGEEIIDVEQQGDMATSTEDIVEEATEENNNEAVTDGTQTVVEESSDEEVSEPDVQQEAVVAPAEPEESVEETSPPEPENTEPNVEEPQQSASSSEDSTSEPFVGDAS
ncbi:MAG: hypothetical protein COV34_01095 [Candidatus Zambryskibacteria bacterium CG10_big_fil_rev_8_21_14_0_10_42_12]|uniref:Peptidase S74 domain-containing protein n=1 Tax=Candidatus Zambryskibacteria bacterium CG10_big_fil_rev_8_21_14_0_10_42_12 TaxID=1975115 RepID=A0A2H0QVA9_9BACT|nr:MAG: hypothetical protein COV34_01095 [Candidatus Zambryskibacteria bacterium CG10_big_fil_rev_8_21_14_0_10_42_12]